MLTPLVPLLEEAQAVGLVGPGPVESHLAHVRGFAEVVGDPGAGILLDLGSGAGLPGLALSLLWPSSRWVLLDGKTRSASFLAEAVRTLDLDPRVTVIEGRAETVAHDPEYRATISIVVARSVAPPAAVAEYAAGFLSPGGTLVVSEPPDDPGVRWDELGLRELGMGAPTLTQSVDGFHFSVITQRSACPIRYPRRTGVPLRKPLFSQAPPRPPRFT